MGLNRSGKTISKIKVLKSKVVVIFDDDSHLDLSKETYTNFYLFEGKYLTTKEINDIKHNEEISKYLAIGIRLATTSLMTELSLKQKLMKRHASKTICDEVLKILRKNDIINDEGYILDYIEYGNEMLYGERKIKDALIKKGVNADRVNKIKFSKTSELKKAKEVVKKLEVNFKKYAYPTRKRKIYNNLLSKGYINEIALQALLSLKLDNDDKLLDNEINNAIKHWLSINEHKFETNDEKIKALQAYLKNKGYSFNDIRKHTEVYYGLHD